VKSCFEAIGIGIADQLNGDERFILEHHRDRIAALLRSQPDIVVSEDVCAGFLNGFLSVGAYLVPDGSIEQESMQPVLGGIYLLAEAVEDVPDGGDPAGFFGRLAKTMDAEGDLVALSATDRSTIKDLVRSMFSTTPDVPLNRNTLSGYVLGLMYGGPYLPTHDGAGLARLMAGVRHLADTLPH
jgi:hypothetical protein